MQQFESRVRSAQLESRNNRQINHLVSSGRKFKKSDSHFYDLNYVTPAVGKSLSKQLLLNHFPQRNQKKVLIQSDKANEVDLK